MAFQLPAIVQAVQVKRPKTEIWYPNVSGLEHREAQQAIRQKLRETMSALEAKQGPLTDPRSEMTGWFEVKTNERYVFSISLYNYAYAGGAHGLTLQQSLTFRSDTGKSYTLAELFKPGSDYAAVLSEQVKRQIAARDVPVFEPFGTIRPDQDYYVADRALVLYFQLYEITPYVYGFPYFPISVYDLQSIVREDGPLGPMVAND